MGSIPIRPLHLALAAACALLGACDTVRPRGEIPAAAQTWAEPPDHLFVRAGRLDVQSQATLAAPGTSAAAPARSYAARRQVTRYPDGSYQESWTTPSGSHENKSTSRSRGDARTWRRSWTTPSGSHENKSSHGTERGAEYP